MSTIKKKRFLSYYYFKQGYALLATESPSTHYFGGEAYHKGAVCPVCRIPLVLIADFDCTQIRGLEDKKLFSELDRLPLYYCFTCCAEKLSYQVSGDLLRVFENKGKYQGDAFPYAGFPASFEKSAMKLEPIPYETAKLLAIVQEIGEYWMSNEDLKSTKDALRGLRPERFSSNCFNRHQIGGLLNLIQGHEYIVCPNAGCEHHRAAKQLRGTRLSELAVIHNDPHSGLPMFEKLDEMEGPDDFDEFMQVVYWVCEECLTITTSNRCD